MKDSWIAGRGWSAISSGLLMMAVLIAGFTILPWSLGAPTAIHALQGSTGIAVGEGPVFLLGDELFPHQCGKAQLSSNGVLSLYAYGSKMCRKGVKHLNPHLLPTDLRIPWALIPDGDRHRLQQLGGSVLEHARGVFQRVIHSPFFIEEYAPLMEDVIRTALRRAWTSPAVAKALTRAGSAFGPTQVDSLVDGFIPVLAEKARGSLWRTVSTSLSAVFGSTDQGARAAAAQLVAEVMADPRVREHLAQVVPALLSTPEATAVGTTLASEVGKALLDDPRLLEMAGHLLTDRRFLGLRPFGAEAERLVAAIPEGLLRMRHRRDHNPLATYVLRAQIRGQRSFIVLLLDDKQEQALAGANLPAAPNLRRIVP